MQNAIAISHDEKNCFEKTQRQFFIFVSTAGRLNAFPKQQQCFLPQAFVLFKGTAECNGACHGTGFFDATGGHAAMFAFD